MSHSLWLTFPRHVTCILFPENINVNRNNITKIKLSLISLKLFLYSEIKLTRNHTERQTYKMVSTTACQKLNFNAFHPTVNPCGEYFSAMRGSVNSLTLWESCYLWERQWVILQNVQLKYETSNRFYNLTHIVVHKICVHEISVLRCNLLHVRAGLEFAFSSQTCLLSGEQIIENIQVLVNELLIVCSRISAFVCGWLF